ncbi:MAG: isopentenyl-diphosphate Delta-isomerase [Ferruginibacter sp.]
MPDVILVDENDVPVGTMEKLEVHEKGLLHRAFSIFIFNKNGDMLLQQRADRKYHSPGLWTNACCSHPAPGEETLPAATRRLQEEMGFATFLKPAFKFTYQCHFDNDLSEHEYDHVFTGLYEGDIVAAEEEVKTWKYVSIDEIAQGLEIFPENYTAWFRIAFPKLVEYLAGSQG